MSKIDELINQLCPDGVEHIRIGDVVDFEQPSKYIVKSTDYSDEFEMPVLTAGQTFILGYTSETNNTYCASKENPVIIFDDFTGAFKWVDFEFKVKSSAMKMLTVNNKRTTLRYIYHVMSNIGFSSDEHKRLWIGIYSDFLIPLPPLEVQSEIVRILDNFTKLTTELTAELTTELASRGKQYKYYRDRLLTFDESHPLRNLINQLCPDGMEKNLSQLCDTITTGKLNANAMVKDGKYPFYTCDAMPFKIDNYAFDEEAILISGNGSQVGHINYYKGKFNAYQRTYVLYGFNGINVRYLLHYLGGYLREYIMVHSKKGSVPYITLPMLQNFKVPVPPVEVQREIVRILDNFSELATDISNSLPAEIEARQKQYDYYRDKLLSFDELKAA